MTNIATEAIPNDWQRAVPELGAVAATITQHLADEDDVRPTRGLWFAALRCTSPQQVSVVILGQDPYHGEDHGIQQAHGLAFSVPGGVRPPPSLKNILSELQNDIGSNAAASGNLSHWCSQGVLLLNAALTTRGGKAGAHKKLWAPFTTLLLSYLGSQHRPLVFILWGADAQKYKALIAPQHVVITSAHPSPLSSYRGFFGSRPFSQCNAALVAMGRSSVHW
jgi:uracil-DNA glycosylase